VAATPELDELEVAAPFERTEATEREREHLK
jgi:hypothetical protein